MDTIGRRLSRDISYSPPDLSRRFETFGKTSTLDPNEFVSIVGSKSSENVANVRLDTFCADSLPLPDLPVVKTKKYKNKRPALNFEPYQRNESETLRISDKHHELPVVKEGLEPPIYQEDRSKAVLKDKMHRELRARYGPETMTDDRPPLPKKNPELLAKYQSQNHQRNQSIHMLEARGLVASRAPVPSPRNTKRDADLAPPVLSILKTSPLRQSNQKMSFERLSREDLLRLSHTSQSEIHEYLSSSSLSRNERQPDPPWSPAESTSPSGLVF